MLGTMKSNRGLTFFNIAIVSILIFLNSARAQLMSSAKHGQLDIYRSCSFHDGLEVVEVDPLNPGVTERSVETVQGNKTIQMVEGNRIGFAYPGTDIFANVKAEQLPVGSWSKQKKSLRQNFAYLLGSSPEFHTDTISNRALLDLGSEGMTKSSISGGVLAFYLLFDDSRHVVVTIYLVNQEPTSRKFQTLDDFHTLESRFLNTYAGCIVKGGR